MKSLTTKALIDVLSLELEIECQQQFCECDEARNFSSCEMRCHLILSRSLYLPEDAKDRWPPEEKTLSEELVILYS